MDKNDCESESLKRRHEFLKLKIENDAKSHEEDKRKLLVEKDKKIETLENKNNTLKTRVGDQANNIKYLNSAITDKNREIDSLRKREGNLSETLKQLETGMQNYQRQSDQSYNQQSNEIRCLREELAEVKAKIEEHKEQKVLLEKEFRMFTKLQEIREKEREVRHKSLIQSVKEETLKTLQDEMQKTIQETMQITLQHQHSSLLEHLKIEIAHNELESVTEKSEQRLSKDGDVVQFSKNPTDCNMSGQLRQSATGDQVAMDIQQQNNNRPGKSTWVKAKVFNLFEKVSKQNKE